MDGAILGLVRRDHECARSDGRDGDGSGEGVDILWGRFCARGVAGEHRASLGGIKCVNEAGCCSPTLARWGSCVGDMWCSPR